MANSLYETDYEQWLESQAIALKERKPDLLDWDNLLELLEMGNPKDVIESNLVILIAHLLKLYVQSDAPDWMTLSWYRSIDEQRNRILKAKSKYKLITKFLPFAIESAYPDAQKLAIKESKFRKLKLRDESEYPLDCPFSLEQILDDDWYPIIAGQ
ncbi:DUF29 domain-containing protein [Gloeocapsa sp. PCC 73106]|uniref:DUF29 domain-containing protein n=1 Tax=Gloeocapsa sp. PCC 73106 TaxID=102232 RepID=UPI0002ABAC12|nr:DUF29 domain-containing protein [Gloeocapsa sp. PCC 73106]ELR99754.1 protein of unknown function DUF29 [Gloeocapsa sp. PCC 73106]